MIIGSTAYPEFGREPKDIDVILMPEEYELLKHNIGNKLVYEQDTRRGKTLFVEGSVPIEVEIASPGTSGLELINTFCAQEFVYTDLFGLHFAHVKPEVLLALKLSHRYLKNSPHFYKTMQDIKLLRSKGFTVLEQLKDWLDRREKETLDYKHPSLAQDKNNFFSGDGVNYLYDHDSIHETVKHFEKPAYKYYQKQEVFCSKELFFDQPKLIRYCGVLEEAYVLALERHQIPNDFKPDRKKSFMIAMEKICTSITSGWFREFSWENFDEIVNLYDESYVDKFQEALKQGLIKPYKEAA